MHAFVHVWKGSFWKRSRAATGSRWRLGASRCSASPRSRSGHSYAIIGGRYCVFVCGPWASAVRHLSRLRIYSQWRARPPDYSAALYILYIYTSTTGDICRLFRTQTQFIDTHADFCANIYPADLYIDKCSVPRCEICMCVCMYVCALLGLELHIYIYIILESKIIKKIKKKN